MWDNNKELLRGHQIICHHGFKHVVKRDLRKVKIVVSKKRCLDLEINKKEIKGIGDIRT